MDKEARRGRARWEGLIARWRSSGGSMRVFAERNGLSYAQLVRWRRRLEPDRKASRRGVTLIAAGQFALPDASSGVVVKVGRVEIELRRGFDADVLAAVVDVLSVGGRC